MKDRLNRIPAALVIGLLNNQPGLPHSVAGTPYNDQPGCVVEASTGKTQKWQNPDATLQPDCRTLPLQNWPAEEIGLPGIIQASLPKIPQFDDPQVCEYRMNGSGSETEPLIEHVIYQKGFGSTSEMRSDYTNNSNGKRYSIHYILGKKGIFLWADDSVPGYYGRLNEDSIYFLRSMDVISDGRTYTSGTPMENFKCKRWNNPDETYFTPPPPFKSPVIDTPGSKN